MTKLPNTELMKHRDDRQIQFFPTQIRRALSITMAVPLCCQIDSRAEGTVSYSGLKVPKDGIYQKPLGKYFNCSATPIIWGVQLIK